MSLFGRWWKRVQSAASRDAEAFFGVMLMGSGSTKVVAVGEGLGFVGLLGKAREERGGEVWAAELKAALASERKRNIFIVR